MLMLFQFSIAYATSAQTFIGKNVKVNIFSSTPVEDIKAASTNGTAVFISENQELAVQVNVKSLMFDKKLMQEHFNENYMESDIYPTAKFKGIVSPKIDLTKDGEHNVVAKGTFTVHGVSQARSIVGKLIIKNGIVNLNANFDVACAAHNIKIPSLVFTKIAEVIKVSIQGSLTPLNK